MQQTTEEELSKLRNTIVEEGINKKNYSDDESDIDSDDELVMKFVNHKNKKSDFCDMKCKRGFLRLKCSKVRLYPKM